MHTNESKSGYVLLMVMLVIAIATITLTSVFKYGEMARIYYGGNTSENQAFWYADAGIEVIKAMTSVGKRPFGENGLPAPGDSITRTFSNGSYTIDISDPTNRQYTITSTGVCNGETNVITTVAVLEGFSQSVLSTRNSGDTRFTREDTIVGPLYVDGPLLIDGYSPTHPYFNPNATPEFFGEVQTTSDSVNFTDGNSSYAEGAVNEVFTKGIYLNQPALDFTGKNSSDYINDIRDAADYTLNGNTDLQINGNTITYGKEVITYTTNTVTVGRGRNRHTVDQITSSSHIVNETITLDGPTTIYVTGHLTVEGTLNGELTIGCNNSVTIGGNGVKYESAPAKTLDQWSPEDLAAINDYFAIVTKQSIDCQGTDPIELHGSFMITNGGIYPTERHRNLPTVNGAKAKMYVFGSIAESTFEYTEGSWSAGFGTYWMFDDRLKGKGLQNYPDRGYSFKSWSSTKKKAKSNNGNGNGNG